VTVQKIPLPIGLSLLFLLWSVAAPSTVQSAGSVYTTADTKTFRCVPPTHREQTPQQAAAELPGDVFTLSEFSGYNVYLTTDLMVPGDPEWLTDPECNYTVNFSTLAVGQYFVYAETVDTEDRISTQSEVVPFELENAPLVVMPPRPPQLVIPNYPVFVTDPLTAPAVFESNDVVKYIQFIRVSGTVNSLGTIQGLFSRDESGTTASGHVSISIQTDGTVKLRNQGVVGDTEIVLISPEPVTVGRPFIIGANIAPEGTQLFVDGVLVGANPAHYPLSDNDLPLVVAGGCWSCTPADRTPHHPIDGSVAVKAFTSIINSDIQ